MATPNIHEMMAVTDTVLLDIKHINDEEHRKLTRHSNVNILDCARYLSEIHMMIWLISSIPVEQPEIARA